MRREGPPRDMERVVVVEDDDGGGGALGGGGGGTPMEGVRGSTRDDDRFKAAPGAGAGASA